jgi:hypothetical protein
LGFSSIFQYSTTTSSTSSTYFWFLGSLYHSSHLGILSCITGMFAMILNTLPLCILHPHVKCRFDCSKRYVVFMKHFLNMRVFINHTLNNMALSKSPISNLYMLEQQLLLYLYKKFYRTWNWPFATFTRIFHWFQRLHLLSFFMF